MARPERYTVDEVADALRASRGLISRAARHLHCEPNTVRNYMQRHEELLAIVEEERERLVDSAEEGMIEAVEEKREPWAIALVLKTLGKKRGYVERVEQTGADGDPIYVGFAIDGRRDPS